MRTEGIITIFVYLALIILPFVGWVKCLIHFLSCDFEASWKAEIIYGIGTCTGLGAIIGYFDFGK